MDDDTVEEQCPRCGGLEFREVECGPDNYENDITYRSDICSNCGLYYSGWSNKWLVDCENWLNEEGAEEYIKGV
jgi:ribosomal protein S27AE